MVLQRQSSDRLPVESEVVQPSEVCDFDRGVTLGKYRIAGLIGRGSMAVVYRAEDQILRRQVALKVFPQRLTKGDRHVMLEQFIREARAAAILDHPNIVRVYEAGLHDGWYFIAMELLEGCNLEELIRANGPLDAPRACRLIADAADALAHAHLHGVLHRDLKPGNLILTRVGRCRVTDFGLAQRIDPSDPFELPTHAIGTPYYISPEAIKGLPATARSDIYSLGATLWHLLAASPPFTGESPRDVMVQHVRGRLPELGRIRPELPEGLIAAVEKAMARNPEDRYDTAAQFAAILRGFAIAEQESATPRSSSWLDALADAPPRRRRIVERAGRRGVPTWLVGLIVLAVVASVVAMALHLRERAIMLQLPTDIGAPVSGPATASHVERATAAPRSMMGQMIDASLASPTPTTPRPTVPGILTMAQANAIAAAARGDADGYLGVTGRVTRVFVTPTGKSARITLDGQDEGDAFYAVVFPRMFSDMAIAFGGEHGGGLVGKDVIIRGRLSMYGQTPQIVINDVNQIEVLDSQP